jgi:hypothetical protein
MVEKSIPIKSTEARTQRKQTQPNRSALEFDCLAALRALVSKPII